MVFKTIIFLIVAITLNACEQFDYNIYEINRIDPVKETRTEYNIESLLSLPKKDTLYLVFTGDAQRFNDDVEDFVSAVNNLEKVDAVFITGDLTDFGTAREFLWINRQLINLKVPFLTVVGNHDLLANGNQLYQSFYGPLDYSFTWNNIRFIVHNTNGRESGFNGLVPNINWLNEQTNTRRNVDATIFISHVPPYDDDFDQNIENEYIQLIRESKNTIFTAFGHRHNALLHQPYEDEIWYLNSSSPSNRIFTYVAVCPDENNQDQFIYNIVPF